MVLHLRPVAPAIEAPATPGLGKRATIARILRFFALFSRRPSRKAILYALHIAAATPKRRRP